MRTPPAPTSRRFAAAPFYTAVLGKLTQRGIEQIPAPQKIDDHAVVKFAIPIPEHLPSCLPGVGRVQMFHLLAQGARDSINSVSWKKLTFHDLA